MFVSYLIKNMESKNNIQILNCSNNKNNLWEILKKTALDYKNEVDIKENVNNIEIIEDKDSYSITIKGLVSNTISGFIWKSTETIEIDILIFKIQETNDTVHINKNLNNNLYTELQKKILQRRKSIETENE